MKSIKERFIGTWNLKHWEVQTLDGQYYSYPYGEDAKGTIIYTAAGRMTAMLMRVNRPAFKIAHSWKGTDEEVQRALKGYTAYSGTFKIKENTVIHQVDMCLFPNWIGTDLKRTFEFNDNDQQLILSTEPFSSLKGVMIKQVLVWERLDNILQ